MMRYVYCACVLGLVLAMSVRVSGQAAAGAASGSDAHADQGATTTIKVGTRVVAISAVVKGKDGEPRGGLDKDDFVLKQDGKEEPIRYFSQGSELPLTFALMVDTSGSQRTFIGDESLASDVFFETMLGRKQDRAMLVQFDTRVLQLRSMTNSANALHLALQGLTPDTAAVGRTLLLDAVYAVAKAALANETGRKAMVLLTDGGDNGSQTSVAQAVEQAQRGNVQIYSILYSMGEGAYPGGTNGMSGGRPRAEDSGMELLRRLSESTGGQVYTVSRTMGLRAIFAKIGEDLRLQYELGYTPPAETLPGSYHKLELRAKDKRLLVQARRGFFAQP